MLVGWTVQLTMGVAFWILPRPERGVSRAAVAAAWLAFILLNAGVLLAAPASVTSTGGGAHLAGRVIEGAAAIAFAVHAWRRIRGAGLGRSAR